MMRIVWRASIVDPSYAKGMADVDPARQRFLELVAEVRPELHRYAARMTGSVADGEDIVQDTLSRAYDALSGAEVSRLRPWLFQIAHRRALDHLRRYDRRMGQPLKDIDDIAAEGAGAEDGLIAGEAVRAALTAFLELPPTPRSCVILKDVLGHSVDEIAALLELSVPAVKAALHRGRARLQARREPSARPAPASPAVVRYAKLFNARDWDGVRAMLAEDVTLDLVSRLTRTGRGEVGQYFGNYASIHDWHLVPAWLDGREVLAVVGAPDDPRPRYFVEVTFDGDRVVAIRDYRHVPYIARDARMELLG